MAQLDEDEILEDDEGTKEKIHEEELALLQRMKALKQDYRAAYATLKETKGKYNRIQQSID